MAKRFKSASGENVRLVLMDGHVTIVGADWRDLHERYHKEAYANGCVSEDMFKNKVADRIPTKVAEQVESVISFDEKILEAIDTLVTENRTDAFNKSGQPDARILTDMVGERVMTAKRDQLWYKYQKDNGIEE